MGSWPDHCDAQQRTEVGPPYHADASPPEDELATWKRRRRLGERASLSAGPMAAPVVEDKPNRGTVGAA